MSERTTPYFEEDIPSQEKELALQELVSLVENHTFLFAQLFHGTGFAAVPGILEEKRLLSHQELISLGREVKTGEHQAFGHSHSTVSYSIHFKGALTHALIEEKDHNDYAMVLGTSKQWLESFYTEEAKSDSLFEYTILGGDSMNEQGEVEVAKSTPLQAITHVYLPHKQIPELKDRWAKVTDQLPIFIDPTTALVGMRLYQFFNNPKSHSISPQFRNSPHLETLRAHKEYLAPQTYGQTLGYPDAILQFAQATSIEQELLAARIRRIAIVLLDPSQAKDAIEPLWYKLYGLPRLEFLVGEEMIPQVLEQLKESKNSEQAVQVILGALKKS